jgi:FMN phosphatase YigB (HAD superfamily)
MLSYKDLDPNKKAFVFELDNVLFPERDYLLQVYYLFSNFIEFTEAFPPASDLVNFFKNSYSSHGNEGIFEKSCLAFGINEKYRENFIRLHATARLPLKLLLYPNVLKLLQDIIVDRKEVFILTDGLPEIQVNKIMQTDWNGLEKYIKVYYVQEIKTELETDALSYIVNNHGLNLEDVIYFSDRETDNYFTRFSGSNYLNINQFI